MERTVYVYKFAQSVPLTEVQVYLDLAFESSESLHGPSALRLEARYVVDQSTHAVVIDASAAVGQDLNRLFLGYIIREFGPGAVHIERKLAESVRIIQPLKATPN